MATASGSMERLILACYSAGVAGERARGSGGVVFVEDEHISYLLAAELQPASLRERVEEILDGDDGRHFVVLHKSGLNVHISMIVRATAPPELEPRALAA